ncbi:MAG: LemA family protein [Planctomycetota bacterium]|nr:MAG: LemA family protein [Planctomycetota bacterium]
MIWILLAAVALLVAWCIAMYNSLVAVRQHVDEAWSNVQTELKRRYDLIPNLVNTVKGYAKHERELLEKLVLLRERAAANTGPPSAQARDESELQRVLGQLMVRMEAYPELKASSNFLELQKELGNTEDRIQAALRFYNGNVRENNTKIQQFPGNVVAGLFQFGPKEFFDLEVPEARQAPKVEF